MCLASMTLVVEGKSVTVSIFCFIWDIPSPDTKCPNYSISFLKNSHFDAFNFIGASRLFEN